jgi:hypothetical protein
MTSKDPHAARYRRIDIGTTQQASWSVSAILLEATYASCQEKIWFLRDIFSLTGKGPL